jgi:pilus assembly protein TadC
VKILFPLILFIFPTVFVIVLGPAATQIGRSFR